MVGFMTKLSPNRQVAAPPLARAVLAVSALALTVFAVIVFVHQAADWPFAAVLIGVAALVVLRGLRARIELTSNSLVVRDYVRTTIIRREQIVSVERFPSIDWQGTNGTPHVTLFNPYLRRAGMITAASDKDRAEARSIIQSWLDTPGAQGSAT